MVCTALGAAHFVNQPVIHQYPIPLPVGAQKENLFCFFLGLRDWADKACLIFLGVLAPHTTDCIKRAIVNVIWQLFLLHTEKYRSNCGTQEQHRKGALSVFHDYLPSNCRRRMHRASTLSSFVAQLVQKRTARWVSSTRSCSEKAKSSAKASSTPSGKMGNS